MAYLNYISDDEFKALVKAVLDKGRRKKAAVTKDFQNNVIDPFASLFDSAISDVDHDTWKKAEMVRQCQKALTNDIGNLHQKILGHVKGWQDLGTGGVVDLVSHERKIIAEIKNKHNTVTGSKLADQYNALDSLISPKSSEYKDYTAYFVHIIPKKPIRLDKPFEPSDNKKGRRCAMNESIRIIDGASFYTLVTERYNALKELYDALQSVIENIYRSEYKIPSFSIPDTHEFKKYFQDAYGDFKK